MAQKSFCIQFLPQKQAIFYQTCKQVGKAYRKIMMFQLYYNSLIILDMQTAKPSITFKHEHYDVEIDVINQTKLTLTITDSIIRTQFSANAIQLTKIGANTLIKAFQKTKQEVKVVLKHVKVNDEDLLEVRISVESAFLKNVQESILLKKIREISEVESVKKSVDYLSKKIRDLKESSLKQKVTTFYGATLEQKTYSGAGYEPLASIKLPKGKYLLTFNFMLKANNQWIYLYFGQGGSLVQNAGYYVPNSSHFIAQTVRKIHTVAQNIETVSFNTYCANSYPINIRNAIIVAKPILE